MTTVFSTETGSTTQPSAGAAGCSSSKRIWTVCSGQLAYVKIESPYERGRLSELIVETVRRNDLENAYVKTIITRGTTEKPLLDARGAEPGCVIFALPYLSLVSDDARQQGVRLKTSTLRRTPVSSHDPRVKSLNYLNIVLGLIEAQAAGADTAVMLDLEGHVVEHGFNVFAARNRVLATPATGVLEGITRATVLELASELGLTAETPNMTLYDLYTADEVFLSSTAGGLMPVREVDGRQIGQGQPGPLYQQMPTPTSDFWNPTGTERPFIPTAIKGRS